MRENLYGFHGNEKRYYLKITVTTPRVISKLRRLLESEENVNYKAMWNSANNTVLTFDNIEYILRFMIDTGVRLVYILRSKQTLTCS
jgi:DNA polymerase delta subunit 1